MNSTSRFPAASGPQNSAIFQKATDVPNSPVSPDYRYLDRSDASFPEILENYEGSPRFLYLKGNLPDPERKSVAIVGARSCSMYGKNHAWKLARILAEHGVQVISGLAYGIDASAHQGSIDGGGKTFAVMGCGIDLCYPESNRKLYEQILQSGGGIISEYEPGSPALPHHFPVRNRIISALADAVVVIEARKKSGSLITANYALDQGKTLYAMPGRVNDVISAGCNELIAQGAFPLLSAYQLLTDLGICPQKETNAVSQRKGSANPSGTRSEFNRESRAEICFEETHGNRSGEKNGTNCESDRENSSGLGADEKKLIRCLSDDPKTLNELNEEVRIDYTALTCMLIRLQLKGLIDEPVPGSYCRAY